MALPDPAPNPQNAATGQGRRDDQPPEEEVRDEISAKSLRIQRRRPDLKLSCGDATTAAYFAKAFDQDDAEDRWIKRWHNLYRTAPESGERQEQWKARYHHAPARSGSFFGLADLHTGPSSRKFLGPPEQRGVVWPDLIAEIRQAIRPGSGCREPRILDRQDGVAGVGRVLAA